MNDNEKAALLKTIDLWEALLKLQSEHPGFINEARHHIHALQCLIAAGPTLRQINQEGL